MTVEELKETVAENRRTLEDDAEDTGQWRRNTMKKWIIEQLISGAVILGCMAFGWGITVIGLGMLGVL